MKHMKHLKHSEMDQKTPDFWSKSEISTSLFHLGRFFNMTMNSPAKVINLATIANDNLVSWARKNISRI